MGHKFTDLPFLQRYLAGCELPVLMAPQYGLVKLVCHQIHLKSSRLL